MCTTLRRCNKLPVYCGGLDQNLPNAQLAAQTVLSLPMHPYLTQGEARQVVDAVRFSWRGKTKEKTPCC